MKISSKITRLQLAGIITKAFEENGLTAVLVGGAVVSIYTENVYESKDLDFISPADNKKINSIMKDLGFEREGKNFIHPSTELTVEFPTGPIGIGDRVPVKPEGEIQVSGIKVTLLSPTQSVMDRLAWFYFNNDRQCLDQAVMIALKQPIKLAQVKIWSLEEKCDDKFEVFLKHLKKSKPSKLSKP